MFLGYVHTYMNEEIIEVYQHFVPREFEIQRQLSVMGQG